MLLPAVDLESCASEPIRVPGSIQPHGWLLASDAETARLVCYSDNCADLLALVDKPSLALKIQAIVDQFHGGVEPARSASGSAFLGSRNIAGRMIDVTAHHSQALNIFELEPATLHTGSQGPLYHLAGRFPQQLERASSLFELTALAAAEMRALTGFGRCLVYSFNEEGHGQVLAEDCLPGYASYRDHWFPSTESRRRLVLCTW